MSEVAPPRHLVQPVDPVIAVYSPESHTPHPACPPVAANVPGSQSRQSDETVAPSAFENLPAGQERHSDGPFLSLYLPDAHALHFPLAESERYPSLQMQAVTLVLPIWADSCS
jgi:hypothetical protein